MKYEISTLILKILGKALKTMMRNMYFESLDWLMSYKYKNWLELLMEGTIFLVKL